MKTRPGRNRSRLRRDYRGGGRLLPSRWRESCDYPVATVRGAALSERLSEARRLSRAKWSATIERLLSDYRRANPAPKFFQTFQKLFKNPIRIFSKPFEKSSGFSAPRVRGCRGRTVSVRGGSAGLETAGSPPGGRDLPPAVIRGTLRTLAGDLAAVQVRRVRRRVSTARCGAAGLAVRRAAAAAVPLLLRSIAVMALWGAYAPATAF
uniref:Uncharacterized protein n=1 Tax=Siphoviridae sp. ctTDf8 TaxID=2825517 RepID=A0A8S5UJ53_9CAUD|nr:MAG TPA: hypothetical protein [Siphoviridae sp. ctTDf8]